MNEYIKKQLKDAIKDDIGVKFDLGCGDTKQTGFLGIDISPLPEVDIVLDLEKIPYKDIPSECTSLLMASHIVEHFKPWLMVDIMNEWWRITKPDGQLMIATPYAGSPMFWQDPTHVKGWSELTPEYFDPFGKMSHSNLYLVYRPKPWRILKNTWDLTGTLEILMEKRPDCDLYHDVRTDFKLLHDTPIAKFKK